MDTPARVCLLQSSNAPPQPTLVHKGSIFSVHSDDGQPSAQSGDPFLGGNARRKPLRRAHHRRCTIRLSPPQGAPFGYGLNDRIMSPRTLRPAAAAKSTPSPASSSAPEHAPSSSRSLGICTKHRTIDCSQCGLHNRKAHSSGLLPEYSSTIMRQAPHSTQGIESGRQYSNKTPPRLSLHWSLGPLDTHQNPCMSIAHWCIMTGGSHSDSHPSPRA